MHQEAADVGVEKMRNLGKRCKESDAYFCWNQTDEQDKCFFKVLIGDFRERLIIPDKFVQHLRGRIAKTLELESRSGYTFDVEVTRNLGKVVLQSGWNKFVSAHDLNMGDFLVFKYDGISRLKVSNFDLTCCEKVLPYLAMRNSVSSREKRGEPVEISGTCVDISDTSGEFISSEDQKSHAVPSYILPKRTHLTCVQKKKLKEKLRGINSKIPAYACIMKKSSISGIRQTMHISEEYAGAYFPFEHRTAVILQRHGRSWEVQCCFLKSTRYKRFLKGWNLFVRDNNLQLGDLCLFELVKGRKYTMNVYVIRKKKKKRKKKKSDR